MAIGISCKCPICWDDYSICKCTNKDRKKYEEELQEEKNNNKKKEKHVCWLCKKDGATIRTEPQRPDNEEWWFHKDCYWELQDILYGG